MKSGIHPEYKAIKVTCSCGNAFETRSTLGEDLQIEVCSNCHPFYTGKHKLVDTAGRIERFETKYKKSPKPGTAPVKKKAEATAAPAAKPEGDASN